MAGADPMMPPRSKANPFAQSIAYWKVTFAMPAAAAATAEQVFDDDALSVAVFETDEENDIWTFELLYKTKPDPDDIHRRLIILSKLHKMPSPKPKIEKLQQTDWLAKVAK